MAIVRDASSPARFNISGNGTGTESGTSASFTPPANSWLFANATINSFAAATPIFNVPTWSGSGVGAFTLFGSNVNTAGGSCAVWRALVGASPSAGTVAISVTNSGSNQAVAVSAGWVDVWTGAASTQTSAAISGGIGGQSTTQNFSPTTTTTQSGSQVAGVGIDWQARGIPTSSDTIDGYTFATQTSGGRAFKAANSGAAGSIALNFNAAAASPQWTTLVYEILASGGAWKSTNTAGPGKHPGPRRFGPIARGYPLAASGAIAGTDGMVFGQTGALTGSGALAGTNGLTFSQTGALTGAGALAGTNGLVFGQTGAITGAGALAGTNGLTFAQTGTITGAGVLAGSSAMVFDQTGTLTQPGMNGTAAMVFGQTGALTGGGALAATGALTFAQTGALAGVGALAGSGAIVFSQTGTLDQPSGAMVGTGLMVFGQSGTLSATVPIVGTGALQFFASATADQPASDQTSGGMGPMSASIGFYDNRPKKSRKIPDVSPVKTEIAPTSQQVVVSEPEPFRVPMSELTDLLAISKQSQDALKAMQEEEEALALWILLQ